MVPLDATLPCVLTDAAARKMAQASATGRFVHDVTRGYAATYARHEGLDGCVLHDVAALVRLTRPELFEVRSAPVSVTLDGERLGQTSWSEHGPHRQVCLNTDGAELARHFQQTLTAS